VHSWITVYPCSVTLRDGTVLDRVYLLSSQSFFSLRFREPQDGDNMVALDEVVAIRDSPDRLPARIVQELYDRGESGMGYHVFQLRFRFGFWKTYVTGNMFDFVRLPRFLGPSAIRGVLERAPLAASLQEPRPRRSSLDECAPTRSLSLTSHLPFRAASGSDRVALIVIDKVLETGPRKINTGAKISNSRVGPTDRSASRSSTG